MRRWDCAVRTRSRHAAGFKKADYQEKGDKLFNPGCGWYHIYTFTALPREGTCQVAEETWLDEECEKEQLALVLIDIGEFRESEFSQEAVSHIFQIMEFFRERKKQMILRFAYDINGAGIAKEPSDLSLVKRHIGQLGGVLKEFAEDILVIQGILVGSWGEMHHSRFLGEEAVCSLLNALYRATESRCYLAVRTPAQWRMAAQSRLTESGLKERLALYNDGMFGSPTDLGTYGALTEREAKRTDPWRREDELNWQEENVGTAPNGGEALSGLCLDGYRQAAELMRKMHISYLNSIYHKERLDSWRKEIVRESGCFKGQSGYEYIGCHLGYRFVVRDVEAVPCSPREKRAEGLGVILRITVENLGFACLTEETDCFVLLEGKDRLYRRPVDTDARRWESGKRTQIEAVLPETWEGQSDRVRCLLELRRKRDGRLLRFANKGAGDQVLLGYITPGVSADL